MEEEKKVPEIIDAEIVDKEPKKEEPKKETKIPENTDNLEAPTSNGVPRIVFSAIFLAVALFFVALAAWLLISVRTGAIMNGGGEESSSSDSSSAAGVIAAAFVTGLFGIIFGIGFDIIGFIASVVGVIISGIGIKKNKPWSKPKTVYFIIVTIVFGLLTASTIGLFLMLYL